MGLKTAVDTHFTHTLVYNIQITQTPSNRFVLFVLALRHSPVKRQSHRYDTNDYRVRGTNRQKDKEMGWKPEQRN